MIPVEMCGTWGEGIRALVMSSLAVSGTVYGRRGSHYTYKGERPGPGWHAHGTFTRWLWILVQGSLRHVAVDKQRWLEVSTGWDVPRPSAG